MQEGYAMFAKKLFFLIYFKSYAKKLFSSFYQSRFTLSLWVFYCNYIPLHLSIILNNTSQKLAIELDPNNAKAWYAKGYTLGKLGKYNEAIQAYDRAIQIDSNYTEAWNEKDLSLKN